VGPHLVSRFRQHQFWAEQLAQLGVIKPHLSSLVSGTALAGRVDLQSGALQATTCFGGRIPLAAGMAVRIPEQIDHSFRRKLTSHSTPN
jgi:hypothetical protein